RVRNRDHFVAGAHAERLVGEAQRVGAAAHADASRSADERREFGLKAAHFRTPNQLRGRERPPERRHQLVLEVAVLRHQVYQRNRRRGHGSLQRSTAPRRSYCRRWAGERLRDNSSKAPPPSNSAIDRALSWGYRRSTAR